MQNIFTIKKQETKKKTTNSYLFPDNGDGTPPKSPVELHLFAKPACNELGRGEGEGAGDTELLLGLSECKDPFD